MHVLDARCKTKNLSSWLVIGETVLLCTRWYLNSAALLFRRMCIPHVRIMPDSTVLIVYALQFDPGVQYVDIYTSFKRNHRNLLFSERRLYILK